MTAARLAFTFMIYACGGDSGSNDAAVDIDNGTCGTMIRFTGEYVDWDSDQSFCGLHQALFMIRDTGMTTSLPPNGRIDLCVPDQPTTLIDITPPSTVPDCKVGPDLEYPLPGIAVANKAVILAGGLWSGRTFALGRETYDPTKAQVYVHIDGPARAVSLDAAHSHGPAQAVVAGTWAPGNAGHEVFLPDVDPSGGSATLSVAGDAIGAGAIPLEAGRMTTLTVITR